MQIPQKKRLGDLLIEGGLITATQLQQALEHGRERNIKVGVALRELGFVNEQNVAKTLSRQLKIPFVDFDRLVIDPKIGTLLPEMVARKHKVLTLGKKPGETLVAFADPLNIHAIDEVSRHLDDKLVLCMAVESRIEEAINRLYSSRTAAPAERTGPASEESEAVSVLNDIVVQAVREEASDIHIEPGDEIMRVRLRVDGLLRLSRELPMELHPSLVSRIKILSQLDIGERRKPQDGRCELPVSGKEFDIRVSTLPLNAGEKVVMRLLDKSKIRIDLQNLGFEPVQLGIFKKHLHRPHEIVLVTGPTGSGKTTTLYGALNHINAIEQNIVTVEDPVEYELPGINQVQVNPRANLTFASALRSILRQDPDVVMIGEIRDVETAEIAIQAALTGHLMLSTLHTNDAAGAIARLVDMDIPPFLIASALGLVVGQRLLRLLCPVCRQPFTPPGSTLADLGLGDGPHTIYRPKGCEACDGVGFRGRTAIYEVLEISKEIEELIMAKAATTELARRAVASGMLTLHRAGLGKVLSGASSLEEVLRVTLVGRE